MTTANLSKSLLLCFVLLWASTGIAADTITGTVRNQTTNQPAVGDDVVLLRLGQGMQQESRTTTDAQGAFTLNASSANGQYLVQVSHQGVNYDQPVIGKGPIQVLVYNAVTKVAHLKGPIGAVQVESDSKVMKVTEMYQIDNASNPPVTQSRTDNFEINVPANAVFDSFLVKSNEGIWTKTIPSPVKGQAGKYDVNFPIRPGATLYRFTYHLPYSGTAAFHLKLPYPIEKFGVMHPPSISFKPLQPGTFHVAGSNGSVILEAPVAPGPTVGDVPAFEISGVGQAPEHGTQAAAAPAPNSGAAPAIPSVGNNTHPAPAKPPSAADQSSRETWLMAGGIVAILLIGALALWRMRAKQLPVIASPKRDAHIPLLESLKEELFQLESNRLHGSISAEEYAATRQALTESIQRAMAKNP